MVKLKIVIVNLFLFSAVGFNSGWYTYRRTYCGVETHAHATNKNNSRPG